MEHQVQEIMSDQPSNPENGQNITYFDVCFGKKYRRATFLGFMLAILQQASGTNIANFYSNSLFESSGSNFAPEEITAIIGVTNFIGVIICMYLLSFFGRRTLMLWGFAGMAISLLMLGTFGLYKVNGFVIQSVILYRFAFEISSGPITWIYLAEILEDKAMGLCAGLIWFGTLVVSAILPSIAASVGKDKIGLIWLTCGASTTIGWFYLYFSMPETKGKTKQQIDQLFEITPHSDIFSNHP